MRKDIDINFNAHPMTGDLVIKRGFFAVEQSMRNLILTNMYERGYNVGVYSNVSNSLFENDLPLFRQTLKNNIDQVIKNYEPDVDLVDVVVTGTSNENEIEVTIYYTYATNPDVQSFKVDLQRLR